MSAQIYYLERTNQEIYGKFLQGNLVAWKTHRPISGILIDQVHVQNNRNVEGDGGAVGIIESSSQLLRWINAGLKISKSIREFETSSDLIHAEQGSGYDFAKLRVFRAHVPLRAHVLTCLPALRAYVPTSRVKWIVLGHSGAGLNKIIFSTKPSASF